MSGDITLKSIRINGETLRITIDTNAQPGDLLLFNPGCCQKNIFDYYSKRTDLIKKPFVHETFHEMGRGVVGRKVSVDELTKLEELEQSLLKITSNYEILVVNGGSTDGTSDVLKNSPVKITLLEHPCNLGYGVALKTGIKNARYEYIGIIDGDGSYPPQEIPGLVAQMKDCEMAIGAKVGKDAAIPLIRRPVKWVLTQLASYLVRKEIPDGVWTALANTSLGYLPEGLFSWQGITKRIIKYEKTINALSVDVEDWYQAIEARPASLM